MGQTRPAKSPAEINSRRYGSRRYGQKQNEEGVASSCNGSCCFPDISARNVVRAAYSRFLWQSKLAKLGCLSGFPVQHSRLQRVSNNISPSKQAQLFSNSGAISFNRCSTYV